MLKPNDYIDRLNRARQKRNKQDDWKYYAVAGAVVLIIIIAAILIIKVGKPASSPADPTGLEPSKATGSNASPSDATGSNAAGFDVPLPDESEIEAAISGYQNIGIVQVNGFLNVRETPSTTAHVVGKLYDESACEIQSTENEWYKITSGDRKSVV